MRTFKLTPKRKEILTTSQWFHYTSSEGEQVSSEQYTTSEGGYNQSSTTKYKNIPKQTKPNPIHQQVTRSNKPINVAEHTTTTPKNFNSPSFVPQAAIQQLSNNAYRFLEAFTPNKLREAYHNIPLEQVCNGVIHPTTGKIINKYKILIEDDLLKETWAEPMCVELGRLAQGYKTKGTNIIRFMTHIMIYNIP